MNMLKRSLAMLLVLCMLFSAVPFSVFAEDTTEPSAVTEVTEQQPDGPGNSEFGHAQGKGKDKQPEATEPVTEATEETVPATTEETVPATTEETVPATTEETVPATTEETVPVTTEETVPATTEETVSETTEEIVPEDNDGIVQVSDNEQVAVSAVASTDGVYTGTVEAPEEFLKVFHLDVGRKYFTVGQVKDILDLLGQKGYSHMELAIGNDGLRFLLNDMSVTVGDTTYDSATVTAGIKAGNAAYSHAGEWSQTDMEYILAYAKTKGIEIIPLVNTPGHMDAILDAMEKCGINGSYNGSVRTVDVTNETAVAFTQALVAKYVEYFASKGCNYFNIGADEYANDIYTKDSTGMGFGHLVSAGKYGYFIDYVNELVQIIDNAGMTPIAFNDGIYYNKNVSFGTFDTRLVVSYWSCGWGGIKPANSDFLAAKNHLILNTNEKWYYVLGRTYSSNSTYCYGNALGNASNVKVTEVVDKKNVTPIGSMQCVWCDEHYVDYANYEDEVRSIINTMADNNTTYFTGPNVVEPEVPEQTDPAPSEPTPSEPVTPVEPDPVVDEETNVGVTAEEVKAIEVAEVAKDSLPVDVVEAAAEGKILAFNVTPKKEDGTDYTGEAKISIPVPDEWTNVRGGVLESAAGATVMDIEGELKDGFFTFKAPHFSTVVGYEVAPTAEENQDKITSTNGGVAYKLATEFTAGGEYVIVNSSSNGTRYALTNNGGSPTSTSVTVASGAITSLTEVNDDNVLWTISGTSSATVLNNGYTLYLMRNADFDLTEDDYTFTVSNQGNGAYRIYRYADYRYNYLTYSSSAWTKVSAYNTYNITSVYLFQKVNNITYKVNPAFQESRILALNVENAGYTDESWAAYQSALTAVQTKLTQVKGETYTSETAANTALNELETAVNALETAKNALVKAVTITINYVDENGATVKTETKIVAENATAVTLESPFIAENGLRYVFDDDTLANGTDLILNLVTTTTYTVRVMERGEPVQIDWWITNLPVTTDDSIQPDGSYILEGDDEKHTERTIYYTLLEAKDANSKDGIPLNTIVPVVGKNPGGNTVRYWKGTALTEGNEQNLDTGRNQTGAGTDFRYIRYYNGVWAVSYDRTEWTAFDTTGQLVAYYLQYEDVTPEIGSLVVDWGDSYKTSYTQLSGKYVLLDYAVRYESGERTPSAFPIANKTLIFHCDYGTNLGKDVFKVGSTHYRKIGAITPVENDQYEVYMITLTPTSSTGSKLSSSTPGGNRTGNTNFYPVGADKNERVVWVDDEANLGEFSGEEHQFTSITGDIKYSVGGEPHVSGLEIYNQTGMLVTYYVRAKASADALTVHYIDKKENLEFHNYNIAVKEGTVFNAGIARNTNNPNSALLNGTVTNYNGKTQTVSADLSTLSQIGAQYLYTEYKCVEVKRSENGKHVYIYYEFDPTVSFVVDFGLPIEITGANLSNKLENVTINDMYFSGVALTQFGKLKDNGQTITYTPTKIMTGVDYFTVVVETATAVGGILDQASSTIAFRVYVAPATTVHYEASFIKWGNGWSVDRDEPAVGNQATEVLGSKKNVYGYDPTYEDTTGASSGVNATTSTNLAAGTFTFTGDGIQVFANSTTETNYVSVEVKNSSGNTVNLSFVNTVVSAGDTSATTGQTGTLNGLPIVSLVDLQNMDHDTYTVTIKKIRDAKNEKPVIIDGIRVFNTLADSSVYKNDLEDNPSFTELRDTVLHAIGVKENISVEDSSVDYKTMYEQVYNATAGANALITDESVTYANSSALQDLLDNGPKNEIYLFKGQTLTFKVNTTRVMQVGLKAPNGSTKANITVKTSEKTTENGTEKTTENTSSKTPDIISSVDMFYELAGNSMATSRTVTVSIKNDGDNILSVTLLKICDDPNYSFVAFSEDDVKNILNKIPLNPNNPVEPEKPTGPEKPTQPTDPEKPNEPVKPNKPIKLEKPLKKTVDAKLKISLVDKNGKVLATTKLKAMGMEGDTAKFDAKTILKTAKAKLPSKYKILDEDSVSSVNVEYGAEKTIKIQIGKVATLKVTYINLKGKKVGTATLTKVQTSGSSYTFSASAIRKAAPKGYSSAKISSVKVSYGKTKTLKVTVF